MDLEATPEERLQLEYATQHFGFTPDSFVETITTTAVENINDSLDTTLKQVKKTCSKKASEQELEESFAVVKNKYVTSAEKVLDNFSRYVKRNILIVPKNIVLPEDKVHLSEQRDVAGNDFYNGDNLVESIKGFERQCQNIQNSKYKEAVLKAKLANLEAVANRQRQLLKQAQELAETRHRIETIVERQEGVLDRKISVLNELLHNNGSNLLNEAKGKEQLKEISNTLFGTNGRRTPPDENCGNGLMEYNVARNSTEKRKLETYEYEEAVLAKKCRQVDDDDAYELINKVESNEENVD